MHANMARALLCAFGMEVLQYIPAFKIYIKEKIDFRKLSHRKTP